MAFPTGICPGCSAAGMPHRRYLDSSVRKSGRLGSDVNARMTAYPIADVSIRADVSELRRASAWLGREAAKRSVPADQIQRLDLCLNEALANVIAYGGTGALQAPIIVELDVRRARGVTEAVVTVSDGGEAFDPLNSAPKARPNSLADAEPGGFGIMMIRSLANKVGYRYEEGLNRLSVSVIWQEAE